MADGKIRISPLCSVIDDDLRWFIGNFSYRRLLAILERLLAALFRGRTGEGREGNVEGLHEEV